MHSSLRTSTTRSSRSFCGMVGKRTLLPVPAIFLLLANLITILAVPKKVTAQNLPKSSWPSADEAEPSYTIPPKPGTQPTFRAPKDDSRLGPVQAPEVFDTEHHVYRVPFRYKNVTIDYWFEYDDKGIEIAADRGSITIVEEKPIVSVTVVGSGCSAPSYNIVEWWAEGEGVSNARGQLIKRQRIDNLLGQHPAWIQQALSRKHEFKTAEEANEYKEEIRSVVYAMTSGFYRAGSLMTGLYENTAYFRISDVTNFSSAKPSLEEGHTFRTVESRWECRKVVIRAGSMDYEDPAKPEARYPGDYAVRLIDIVVKK